MTAAVRTLRTLRTLLFATLLAVFGVLAPALVTGPTTPQPGATAYAIDPNRGTPGPCPDASGVTVVIDFQQVGTGEVVVRCAPNVHAGSTGLDALYDAGFQIEGTRRWGEGFICRIENVPAPGEDIPINGDPNYREPCIDTPPALAYWSYWHAPDGGTWEYSNFGVKNRTIIPGGFEGWSFSLNATEHTNPPPRVPPTRPAPVPSPMPTPSPTPSPSPGPSPSPTPGATPSATSSATPGGSAAAGEPGGPSEVAGDTVGEPSGDQAAAGPQAGTQPGADQVGADEDPTGDTPDQGEDAAVTQSPGQAQTTDQPRDEAAQTLGAGSGVVVTGGEELLDRRTEQSTAAWLGVPVSLWLTVVAVLVLLGGGAALARRRASS